MLHAEDLANHFISRSTRNSLQHTDECHNSCRSISHSYYCVRYHTCRKKFRKDSSKEGTEEEPQVVHAINIPSQIVGIDYSKEEGEVELHDAAVHATSGVDS